MADVSKIDIDGVQWDIKDQNARDKIAALETKISGLKIIRHDLSKQLSEIPSCLWDCILKTIPTIDWSFISKNDWSYGSFEIKGICLGTYEALRHNDDTIEVKGTLTYNAISHVFSCFYLTSQNKWEYQIDGETLEYLNNGILITLTADHQFNQFSISSQVFVRNIAPTTIGNLYTALETLNLLNRPSTGILVWDLQRQHDGADLPKFHVGYPAYASTKEISFSGRGYFETLRMGIADNQSSTWIFNWNNGNDYFEGNMWGEPLEGIVPAVSLAFVV